MDKAKIEHDEYVNWKAELEAEEKEIKDNYGKLEENIVRLNTRYRVLLQVSEDPDKKAYGELQAAQGAKKKCEEEMYKRLNVIERLLMAINSSLL